MITLISAERFNKTKEENQANNAALEYSLMNLGLHYEKVKGMYKGSEENSFMILGIINNTDMTRIKGLATIFEQDSILTIDHNRNATLVYMSGVLEILGKWTKVNSVKGLDGYTVLDDGTTFTVI